VSVEPVNPQVPEYVGVPHPVPAAIVQLTVAPAVTGLAGVQDTVPLPENDV